ncbi:site-specific DNA-methyltransferase [Laedolimicola intestinihominis]|uniref:Site-specific DNA-methyltransferase n=1 Tax=Laedolimicola intestinihominis TaxID=3133166 RepID=A0ABV1FFA4_9FIRM
MDKMRMESIDMTAQNIEKIGALFPNCITETKGADGKPKKAINFELLRQMLSGDVVEGDEAYEFTWVGKKAAIVEANKPIRKTLRPCKEESVNWDSTENLYIEGDNLEVLKLLQESYLSKVKMIYIDPPYNTGNDFIYRDDFKQSAAEYDEDSGVYDEDGNRMFKNTDTNGRFHSDWCSMIYSRLMMARNLLTDDGVIFISIDDNEQENLKKCCSEVFGGQNFVAQLVWERAFSPKNDARFISNSHDYVLMYVKDITRFVIGRLPRTEEANARYSNPDNDPRGVWMSSDISVKTYNAECDYPITAPSGRVIEPPAGRCWSLSKKSFLERLQDNRIWFGPDGNGVPRIKRFLTDLKHDGMAPTSIMFFKDVGHSQEGAQEVSKLLDGGYFSGPKPQRLMQRLLTLANLKEDSIVLDFFSGSASTAHAVMSKNAEDTGNRKFIMVQLPEPCDEKSEAYKAGYSNICEIGKERIRRAAKKIAEEHPDAKFDGGFRVLKLDDTNMKDVYYAPADYQQNLLEQLESNIKEDRTDLDLLFGCLLEWGLPLSLPYQSENIEGCTVHNYNDGDLIACFDENIPDSVMKTIAKRQPLRVVFRDSSFAGSPAKINVTQIFKELAPDTSVKVL